MAQNGADHDATKPIPCCGNCVFFFPFAGDVAHGTCHEQSPRAILVGMRPGLLGADPVPVTNGYFAPTSANVICGKHPRWADYVEMRAALVAEHMAKIKAKEHEAATAETDAAGHA